MANVVEVNAREALDPRELAHRVAHELAHVRMGRIEEPVIVHVRRLRRRGFPERVDVVPIRMLLDDLRDVARHAPHPRVHLEPGRARDRDRLLEPLGAHGEAAAAEQRVSAVVDLGNDPGQAGGAPPIELALPVVGGALEIGTEPEEVLAGAGLPERQQGYRRCGELEELAPIHIGTWNWEPGTWNYAPRISNLTEWERPRRLRRSRPTKRS